MHMLTYWLGQHLLVHVVHSVAARLLCCAMVSSVSASTEIPVLSLDSTMNVLAVRCAI